MTASDENTQVPLVEGGCEFLPLKEGEATIYYDASRPEEVFYNPVQEFNRDLSVAAIQRYLSSRAEENPEVKGFRILEALSATGLRSIRYAKEISVRKPNSSEDVPLSIIANDMSKRAFASIERNLKANGVEDRVRASHSDATAVMYASRSRDERFDVIDLDPYGSPTVFLDGAVQSVAEGGLICVTCTDMAVLSGNASETCYTKYGAVSLKSKCSHEMALRIVLQCIEAHANRYGRYTVPLLSLSIDFYVRLFVRVFTSQKTCKRTTSKLGHVFQCTGCESISISALGKVIVDGGNNTKYKLPTGPPIGRNCEHCCRPFRMGGPFWLAPMYDTEFVRHLLEDVKNGRRGRFGTIDRIEGMLSVVEEELPDVPFYYNQDRLHALVRVGSSKMSILRSALLNAGYRVSLSHAHKLAVKTDAPNAFIWKMMRAYSRKIRPPPPPPPPPGEHRCGETGPDSVASKLNEVRPEDGDLNDINFEIHEDAIPDSKTGKLKRFQVNPLPNWGPKMKAHSKQPELGTKRKINQGKNSASKMRVFAPPGDEDSTN